MSRLALDTGKVSHFPLPQEYLNILNQTKCDNRVNMFIIQRMVNIAIRVNSCVSERVFVHRRPGVATAMTIAATDTMNKAAVSNL